MPLLLLQVSPSSAANLPENAEPQFIETSGDSGKYKASINQNDLRGHHVINVQCSLNESTSEDMSIGYSLVNNGGDYFSINQTSGFVTLARNALLFPIQGEYSVLVSCHVTGTESRASTTLTVTYTIENEYPPVFTHNNTIEVWIREDHNVTANPLVVTLNATDEDLGGCGQIIYLISSGNKGGVFYLNSTSGAITLRSGLDYEKFSEYKLIVRAVNRPCRESLHATAMVTVHVININDEPPMFSQHVYNVSINENEAPHNFLKLSCTDQDTSPQNIVYVRQFQHKPFVVDHETGNISATRALDYEQQDSYVLTFACVDLSHPDRPRDETTVNIEVKPINEFRPVIKSPPYGHKLIFIQEDVPIGTLIASGLPNTGALVNIRVVDRDKGEDGKVQFTLASRNNFTFVNRHFALDATTGNLTLTRPIVVDQCPENYVPSPILVALTACDIPGGNEHCPNIKIRILVIPSECVPSFTQSNYEIKVNETEEAGTLLEVIPCELPTIVEDQNTSIEIVSPSRNADIDFSIDENGALSLRNGLDYEQEQNYSFLLGCFDSKDNEVFASVKIFVLPENDNRPYFDKALYIFNITTPISTTPYVVGTLQAKDKDLDYGGTLQYSKATISPVNFSITPQSGNIIIENLPSSSSLQHDVFVFDIEATDGSFTATTTILILLNTDTKLNNCSSANPDTDTNQLAHSQSICGTGCYILLGIVVAMILLAVVVAAIVVLRLSCLRYQIKEKDDSSEPKDVKDDMDLAMKYVPYCVLPVLYTATK